MKTCPHCGGHSGYEYKVVERTVRSGSWGEGDKVVQTIMDETPFVSCSDCGKRVKRSMAQDPS